MFTASSPINTILWKVYMGLISLNLKPIFVLFILISLLRGNQASENYSMKIKCLMDYLNDLVPWLKEFYEEMIPDGEEEESVKEDKLGKIDETLKEDKLGKIDKTLKEDESCKTDDSSQIREPDSQQKCSSEESKTNSFDKGDPPLQDVKIPEITIQRPVITVDFQTETNIKFKERSTPLSPDSLVNFKLTAVLLFVLLIAVVGSFFFYWTIENLRKLMTEKFSHQDEVLSDNVVFSNEGLDQETVSAERSSVEWTAEKVFRYLRGIADKAAKEFPNDENVKHLSDEFLTKVVNYLADRNRFSDIKYLTPYALLQHAKHYHHCSKSHSFGGDKKNKVQVIVDVDGVHKKAFGSSSSLG